jgi:hypothetical protein
MRLVFVVVFYGGGGCLPRSPSRFVFIRTTLKIMILKIKVKFTSYLIHFLYFFKEEILHSYFQRLGGNINHTEISYLHLCSTVIQQTIFSIGENIIYSLDCFMSNIYLTYFQVFYSAHDIIIWFVDDHSDTEIKWVCWIHEKGLVSGL